MDKEGKGCETWVNYKRNEVEPSLAGFTCHFEERPKFLESAGLIVEFTFRRNHSSTATKFLRSPRSPHSYNHSSTIDYNRKAIQTGDTTSYTSYNNSTSDSEIKTETKLRHRENRYHISAINSTHHTPHHYNTNGHPTEENNRNSTGNNIVCATRRHNESEQWVDERESNLFRILWR